MTKVLWESQWLSVQQDGHADEFLVSGDEVLMVALDQDDHVLMVEEPSPAFACNQLFLPGGAIKDGEPILEAAQRELREETGYRADLIEVVGSIRPWPKYLRVTSHLVRATRLVPSPLEADEAHPIIVHRKSRDELRTAVQSGAICDARIIAALTMCLPGAIARDG